ncbi:MAG: radical SAM protein [Candidatus Pacearchaeota archaeon]|nr:radical SAM protein [Candidatus Pacearchaeota archaeon]
MVDIEKKYGSLKIFWHPDKLRSLLEGKITAPIYVRIKPTNKCDHHCYYCSYDPKVKTILSQRFKRNDEIPKEKMMEILSDFRDMGVKAVTFSGGGEPLIYPHISETLQKTLDYGINLSIITNGQNLNQERAEILTQAKWVRVSLDSSDPETFKEIRRVPTQRFHELISNLRNFARIKNPKCEFGINFVVNEKNFRTVYDSINLFKEIGLNHVKVTPTVYPLSASDFFEYHKTMLDSVMRQIEKARKDFSSKDFTVYDTYENDFSVANVFERSYASCPIMQTVPVIGADSTVYFCHDKTYSNNGMLGSLKDRSFKDLWFSEEAAKIFKTFNPQEGCKHHCTNDLRNKLIIDTMACYGEHVNFI